MTELQQTMSEFQQPELQQPELQRPEPQQPAFKSYNTKSTTTFSDLVDPFLPKMSRQMMTGWCVFIIVAILLLAVLFQTGFGVECLQKDFSKDCLDNEIVWGSLYGLAGGLGVALCAYEATN